MCLSDRYTMVATMQENQHSIAYRAIRKEDQLAVIIKALAAEHPELLDIARLEQEYKLLKSLEQVEGISKPLEFTKLDKVAIVLEDKGLPSLEQVLKERPLTVKEFLPIAILLTEILGNLHQQHVIHKDIKPANIIVDVQNQIVQLIDFNIATKLPAETQSLQSPESLEGTLAYMSPEQTGRMGRPIDYRSDFYSLGATFFEMLTGRVVFEGADLIGMVHAHLAKVPPNPSSINSRIPPVVSEIILKLLAKTAEERYQSAFGLIADLQNCLEQLNTKGKIEPFPLAQKDIPDRVQISRKLYGREKEIEILVDAFKKAANGENVTFMVCGYIGIGKTSLIQESLRHITEKNGYYCHGKFDQYKQAPYGAWIEAFRELIKQILTEKEEKITLWKQQLQSALGQNGQVVIDLIPEVEILIGKQPAVPELAPADAMNRFYQVFKDFFHVLATKEHPLVIFLDDLQWTSHASLELFTKTATEFDLKHIMVIGSYRNNEVQAGHPLLLALEHVQGMKKELYSLTLAPLTYEVTTQWLADTFHAETKMTEEFAKLCFAKTQGNPFFLNQFLQMLANDKLIRFDLKAGRWEWDLNQIKQKNITDNVVELMITRLHLLPEESQHLLQLGACIGVRFDLATLANIADINPREAAKNLWPALEAGYLIPLEADYKLAQEIDIELHYQFTHDRVQQAAYEVIDKDTKKQLHLKIGKRLLQLIPDEAEREKRIFDIVNQLNQAVELQVSEEDKLLLARLNLTAGKIAKSSLAFQVAFNCLNLGLKLLGDYAWQKHYELCLAFHEETAETAYLINNYELMESLTSIAFKHAKDSIHAIRSYEVRLNAYIMKGAMGKAIDLSTELLASFGIKIPKSPGKFDIFKEFLHLKWNMIGKNIENLINAPEITDPKLLAAFKIMFTLGRPAFNYNPLVAMMLCMRLANLSIKNGNCSSGAFAFALCSAFFLVVNDTTTAVKFQNLSLALCDKFNVPDQKSIALLNRGFMVTPRVAPLKRGCPDLLEGYQVALNGGYPDLAWTNMACYASNLLWSGEELKIVYEKVASYYPIVSAANLASIQYGFGLSAQYMEFMQGDQYHDLSLEGNFYNHDQAMKGTAAIGNNKHAIMEHLMRGMVAYYFEKYSEAVAEFDPINIEELGMMYMLSIFALFDALARINIYPEVAKAQQKKLLKKVNSHLKVLNTWAKTAPMNYIHKWYMVKAELARLQGKDAKAIQYYEKAIELLQANPDYIQELALANELLAKYYLQINKIKIAKVYMTDAYYQYLKWGAKAKCKFIQDKYPQLLINEKAPQKEAESFLKITTSTSATMPQAIDLGSILKATQAMSSEVVLPSLVTKILMIMQENIGADRCILLLKHQDKFCVEGDYSEGKEPAHILESIPLANWEAAPHSVIEYVVRTKEYLLLRNVEKAETYKKDVYIERVKPRSILCAPIIHQQVLVGVLYFENKLAVDAFTRERLELLGPLSTQAAISIENARLYNASERFVPKEFFTLLDKRNIIEIKLGDVVQKEVTILFSDIKGFTTFSEQLQPAEVFKFINIYLGYMEPVIAKHNGFIDKYLGDGIMAIFPGHPDDALAAAIDMQEAIATYNQKEVIKPKDGLYVRCGINTGVVMLGTIGSEHRIDGSVIADAVNMAARMMDLNPRYGTDILIGEGTFNKLKDPEKFAIRNLGLAQLRGKNEATKVFEVIADSISMPNPKVKIVPEFEKAQELYQQRNFDAATQLFKKCLKEFPNDKASQLFLEYCQAGNPTLVIKQVKE